MTESVSIHDACRNGDIEQVRRLLLIDPKLVDADDQHHWRPIFHAGLCRHEPIVRLLIASGADLAAHNGDVLHYAGEVPENKPIVRLLVEYGALDAHVRPTSDLSRQLLCAVFVADCGRVASLLKLHPELATTIDGRGDAPIHHAARNGDLEVVKLLIQFGADVNGSTPRGHTVLYCAGGHGHLDVVQLLLQHGSDPDVKFTKDGKDLIQWLAQFPEDTRFAAIAGAIQVHKELATRRQKEGS